MPPIPGDIDDLITESRRLREELIRMATKLEHFSAELTEESMDHTDRTDHSKGER